MVGELNVHNISLRLVCLLHSIVLPLKAKFVLQSHLDKSLVLSILATIFGRAFQVINCAATLCPNSCIFRQEPEHCPGERSKHT